MTTLMNDVYEELLNRGYVVDMVECVKLNEKLKGLVIKQQDDMIAPIVYDSMLEQLERQNTGISGIVDALLEHLKDMDLSEVDPKRFLDAAFILEHAQVRLCRGDWNKEYLEQTVSEQVEGTDLYIYPAACDESYSVMITKQILKDLDLSAELVMEKAKQNTRENSEVLPMSAVLSEFFGDMEEVPDEATMVLLSNRARHYGAGSLIDRDALEKARTLLHAEEIFLIPSSVHELLAIKAVEDTAFIKQMICDVNADVVEQRDILSDHAYLYDGTGIVSVY